MNLEKIQFLEMNHQVIDVCIITLCNEQYIGNS